MQQRFRFSNRENIVIDRKNCIFAIENDIFDCRNALFALFKYLESGSPDLPVESVRAFSVSTEFTDLNTDEFVVC